MTTHNVDSKLAYVQALASGPDSSLSLAVDLLDELGEIQNFIMSGAVTGLGLNYLEVLHDRQADLLSQVSLLVSSTKRERSSGGFAQR